MSLGDFKVVVSDGSYGMVIDASPDSFDEARGANWAPYATIHTPVQLLGYGGTTSRTFNLSFRLISRTAHEATINKGHIQVIRFWVMNDFGVGKTRSSSTCVASKRIP